MRVLFLSHRYTDTTLGGLAEFLYFLPQALNEFAIKSYIYTYVKQSPDNRLYGPDYLDNQIPHYSGPFLKPRLLVRKSELRPLIQLCIDEKIDLVHAQGLYRAGYMAMYLKRYTGIPYVVTSHSDILGVNSERIRRGRVLRRCKNILKQADVVTHLTLSMEHYSHAIYPTSEKNKIIHNGVDIASLKCDPSVAKQDYMLAIGRLEREKGFFILIDAYAKLLEHEHSTSLVIAGSGSKEKELHEYALSKGINILTQYQAGDPIPEKSIIFTGYIRGEEKKKLFCHAKLFLFATQPRSWEEAFGIVQLESMAAGLPVIASDIQSTRYLKDLGLEVLLVTPHEENEWVSAMQRLLDNDALRLQMGKQNQLASLPFDWRLIAKDYAEIYKKLV